jgi:LacI family transcriptional regulator
VLARDWSLTGRSAGGRGGGIDGKAASAGVRDVARRAGVSLGTVSNVLNNPDRVRPETRARVEAAMEELSFVGSVIARQFRHGLSQTVGVLVPDLGNPFWADVLRGVEDVLLSKHLALFVSSSRQDPDRELEAIAAFERHQVDGLLLAPSRVSRDRLAPFERRPLGIVTVDGRLKGSEIPSVTLDDVTGGFLLASHLLALGHRNLILVNGPTAVSWCRDRRKGVRKALIQAGIDPHEALHEVKVDELTVDEGVRSCDGVLQFSGTANAIICANDLLGLGVLIGLRRHGYDVPKDFALAGFDDVDFAAVLSPALTSVRQPARDMGTAAARLLLQQIAGRRHVRFKPELVVRESTIGHASGLHDPGSSDPVGHVDRSRVGQRTRLTGAHRSHTLRP